MSPPRDDALPCLPARFPAVILAFAPLFLQCSWRNAEVLLIGAILVPGQHTVTSILRIMGLKHEQRFVNFHRLLNPAAWCPRAVSCTLLGLLVAAFVPRGAPPKASTATPCASHRHFVKASGLRWLGLMIAERVEIHLRQARVGSGGTVERPSCRFGERSS